MTLVAFDTETTGLIAGFNEIIEIGAFVLDPITLVPTRTKFECKMKPNEIHRANPGVMGIKNHWDEATWDREGLTQSVGFQYFADWLVWVSQGSGRPMLLGHNVSFDIEFLDRGSAMYGIVLHKDYHKVDTIDTMRILKDVGGVSTQYYRLEHFAKMIGIENPKAHGALADAATCGLCYALATAYLKALVECGRHDHETMLNEAYRRCGLRRLPIVSQPLLARPAPVLV